MHDFIVKRAVDFVPDLLLHSLRAPAKNAGKLHRCRDRSMQDARGVGLTPGTRAARGINATTNPAWLAPGPISRPCPKCSLL